MLLSSDHKVGNIYEVPHDNPKHPKLSARGFYFDEMPNLRSNIENQKYAEIKAWDYMFHGGSTNPVARKIQITKILDSKDWIKINRRYKNNQP